jgi:hypothetical protein
MVHRTRARGAARTHVTTLSHRGPVRLIVIAVAAASLIVGVEALAPTAAGALTGWSSPVQIDSGGNMPGVSCVSASFCVAVDAAGSVLTYNGNSWSPPQSVDPGNFLNAVSCPTATFCVAGDLSGNVLTFNGTSWSSPDPVDPGNFIYAVSCPTSSFCAAVDSGAQVLTYNGVSWSAPATVAANPLDGVSCVSASFCVAVDSSGNVTTYDGSSWSAPASIDPGNILAAVSCPTSSFCVTVDQAGNVLSYDGTSWSAPLSVDPGNSIAAPSCPTVSFCAAVDQVGNVVTFDGSSWSSPASIDPGGQLNRVSCPTSSFCAAVDANGNAVTYAAPVTTTCTSGTTCGTTLMVPSQTVTVAGTKSAAAGAQITLSVTTTVLACNDFSYVAPVATLTDSGLTGTSVLVTDVVGNLPSKKGIVICYQPVAASPPPPSFLGKCHGKGPVPCIKSLKEEGGSVKTQLLLPVGDPRFHIGGETPHPTSVSPTSAAPGKKITIKGTDLSEVTGVSIGGATAHIIKTAPTKVSVTVPATATTGLIAVTSLAGRVTLSTQFTVR